ncbi:hypothetical protein EXU48_02785 [Occultella glacieicola]|uniref:DUF3137 domain-containing protein n=1 Tax=Occultella glacieicola TaxID=2518684 RepID=A0ABY2E9C7_9MICO|nr:hypothetical protein [Occultella glacieicola]TDE99120.1 hypothetical protein EXU48_02785 [Occultella glacieicola]
MSNPAPTPRRTPAGTRTRKRVSRTLGTILTTVGVLSTAVTCGALETTYSGGLAAVDAIIAVAFVLMVVTAVIGAIWASVVLIGQAVVRIPRRRRLREWAGRVGWAWFAKGKQIPPAHTSALRACQPVNGHNEDKRAKYSELLTGTYRGREALAYHFERGSGYLLEVDQIIARRLRNVLPTVSFVDRATDDVFTGQQVRFESAAFNHHWRVDAEEPRYASAFTHPRLMELLNHADASVTEIHLRGDYLISHAPTNLTPSILEDHLRVLAAIDDGIPEWVWREYAGRISTDRLGGARS